MSGLVTAAARVKVGKNSGLATRLKRVSLQLINVHCVCHQLALTCAKTVEDKDMKNLSNVQLWLTQLRACLENSNKRTAAFLKAQEELGKLEEDTGLKKVAKKLKKACKTQWLSFDQAVQTVIELLVAALLTLHHLKANDATATGLYVKMNKVSFISDLYVLSPVLLVLSGLSMAFQKGYVNSAWIHPAVQETKAKLSALVQNCSPVENFKQDMASDGRLGKHLELKVTDHDVTRMTATLVKYNSALQKNIDERLGDSLPVLKAMAVFDPVALPKPDACGFPTCGNAEAEVLANHFWPEDEEKAQQLQAEWDNMKYTMHNFMSQIPPEVRQRPVAVGEQPGSAKTKDLPPSPTQWFLKEAVKNQEIFLVSAQNLYHISQVAIMLPLSNAWPERGVSKLRLVKTRLRSSLKNDILNALLHMSINRARSS